MKKLVVVAATVFAFVAARSVVFAQETQQQANPEKKEMKEEEKN